MPFILALALALSLGSTGVAFEVQIPVALATWRAAALAELLLAVVDLVRALAVARSARSSRAMAAIAAGGRRSGDIP